MTMPEAIELREITLQNARDLASSALGLNLGSPQLEQRLKPLLDELQSGSRIFLLDWEGSKIPRGVNLEGHVIARTQHSMVTSDAGEMIGTYQRTIEFGGS